MKFVLFIVGALLAIISATQACRCPPLADPQYCRVNYLMLVKIMGLNVDTEHFKRTYTFQLVEDISYPKPFVTTFNIIETGYDGGSCQLDLEVGKYYLLGGQPDESKGLLWATSCHTFFREWDLKIGSAESKAELLKLQTECQEFHAKNPDNGKNQ